MNKELAMCWNHSMQTKVGCAGMHWLSRRQALSTVAGIAGASWLTTLAEHLARAADTKSKNDRPKSLLILWLQGGPSQLETFDPHPGTKLGGQVGAISTSVPKLQIADTLPQTAEQMHLATLVRSVVSKEGDHERATYNVKTGWRPDPTLIHPSIGSVLCYQQPSNLEIPRHISILASQWPARGGYLGPAHDAFQLGDPAEPVPNLTRRVEPDRMDARVNKLLGTLEEEFRRGRLSNMDRQRTQHQTATQRAITMMSSEQLDAFDIQKEASDVRSSFGNEPFGRGCLAAVRLIERGVRCVEVELRGWDTHINNHELQVGQAKLLDSALASTLRELEKRELLENTVVFCGGEFGRTPTINNVDGRDHWPHGFSVLLAGGAFRRGHVHGTTTSDLELAHREQESCVDSPVPIANLHATMLQALGIEYSQELMTPVGRPLRLSDGSVEKTLLNS